MSSNPAHDEGILDTPLCDQVCQLLVAGRLFSPGTPVSSINKTDCNEITEILLKVAVNPVRIWEYDMKSSIFGY